MGQKIHPLTFRQHNCFKSVVDVNLKNLNFRTRFQQEIELRRLFLAFSTFPCAILILPSEYQAFDSLGFSSRDLRVEASA